MGGKNYRRDVRWRNGCHIQAEAKPGMRRERVRVTHIEREV